MNDETKEFTDEIKLLESSMTFDEADDLTFRHMLKFWANERRPNEKVVIKMQGGAEHTVSLGNFKNARLDLDSDVIGWVYRNDNSVEYVNIHRIISLRIYKDIR